MKKLFAFLALLVCLLSAPPVATAAVTDWWVAVRSEANSWSNDANQVQPNSSGIAKIYVSTSSFKGKKFNIKVWNGSANKWYVLDSQTLNIGQEYTMDESSDENCGASYFVSNNLLSDQFEVVFDVNTHKLVINTWDFTSNTRPCKIEINRFSGATSALTLEYNSTTKIWSKEFNDASQFNFTVKCSYDNNNYVEFYRSGKSLTTISDNSDWVTNGVGQDGSSGNHFWVQNMVNGTTYRLEVRANLSDPNDFDWRVVSEAPATIDNLYYEGDNFSSGSNWSKGTTAYKMDGTYPTFTKTIEWTAAGQLRFDDGTDYYTRSTSGTGSYDGAENDIVKETNGHCFQNIPAGTYDVSVNLSTMKVTITPVVATLKGIELYTGSTKVAGSASSATAISNYAVENSAISNKYYVKATYSDGVKYFTYNNSAMTEAVSGVSMTESASQPTGFGFGSGVTSATISVSTDFKLTTTVTTSGGTYKAVNFKFYDATASKNRDFLMTSKGDGTYELTLTTSKYQSMDYIWIWDANEQKNYGTDGDYYVTLNGDWFGLKVTDGTKKVRYSSAASNILVTYDSTNKRFKIESEMTAHMPLTSADFKDGKAHYFIVGARMGQWHLQPEWELTESTTEGGKTVLKLKGGRYMFPTGFAIAKVDSYRNYAKHIYSIYGNGDTYAKGKNPELVYSNLVLGNAAFDGHDVTVHHKSGEDKIMRYETYDADTRNGYEGDWYDEIKVTLNAEGAPEKVQFISSNLSNASPRVFQLVGAEIYNQYFTKGTEINGLTMQTQLQGVMDTMKGWGEGWIQYDETGNPYYDAYGKYLYQTVYTSDWLDDTKHYTFFNMNRDGESDFEYISPDITFNDAAQFTSDELASDPYREFYKAFSGTNTTIETSATAITGGDASEGTAYSFKPQVTGTTTSATASDWICYVAKDLWMQGEFKIWSGQGGNNAYLEGTSGESGTNYMRWNGINGGPSQTLDIKAFDITAGSNATLYNNIKNEAINYNIADLTYFNRVIFWYSPTLGIDKSFIQFVQMTCGPAITAHKASSSSRRPEYEWTLNNTTGSESIMLKSYTVNRYLLTSEGYELDDATEVNVALNKTVSTFMASAPLNYSETKDLPAGIYIYEVVLKFDDGTEKVGRSNKVTIYDSANMIQPMNVPMQLLQLTDAGEKEYRGSVDPNNDYYLTYRRIEGGTPNYYVVNHSKVGHEISHFQQITADDARKIIADPAKYIWTSKYLVVGLSQSQYESDAASRKDQQLITEISEPAVKVYDMHKVDDDGYTGRTAQHVEGTDYYMAITETAGDLREKQFKVELTYYVDDDIATMSNPRQPTTVRSVDPVVPKPFEATVGENITHYTYAYTRDADPLTTVADAIVAQTAETAATIAGKVFYKVTVPSAVSDKPDCEVLIPENEIKPRHLDCTIYFQRPNLSAEIVANYKIRYNISLTNSDDHDDLLNFSGEYVDENTTLGTNAPYEIVITDVHPSAAVYPVFKIVETVYEANDGSHTLVAEYGNGVPTINAINTPTDDAPTVEKIGFGVGPEVEDKLDGSYGYKWLYMGHQDFSYEPATIEGTTQLDATQFFMFETTGNYTYKGTTYSDYYCAPYLAKHEGPHTGMSDSTNDSYYGTCIASEFAKGIPFETIYDNASTYAPTVHITPVYVFKRTASDDNNDLDGSTNTNLVRYDSAPVPAPRRRDSSIGVKVDGNAIDVTQNADGNYVYTPSVDDGISGTYATLAGTHVSYSRAAGETGGLTGIENVMLGAEESEAVYYTVSGVRVARPAVGQVYIVRRGSQVTKELIR